MAMKIKPYKNLQNVLKAVPSDTAHSDTGLPENIRKI